MSARSNPAKRITKKNSKSTATSKRKTSVSKKSSTKISPSKSKLKGKEVKVKKAAKDNVKIIKKSKLSTAKEKKVIAGFEAKEKIEKALVIKRVRKSNKKPIITLPEPPKIDVSNFPKNKIKNILVSQPQPAETEKNPYFDLAKKFHIGIHFRQFISVQGLSAQEFRSQRIDILQHGAVILTSKLAVDHYYRLCNEMRLTVPESMKYFCINEQTAYYLQKYIQYRKRKIFFGHGTILDLVDVIRKNKAEKFLLPASDVHKEKICDFLDEVKITYTKATFYKTISANLKDMKGLSDYDALVFFTPAGIKSLKQNFPTFKQAGTRIGAFGHATALAVKNMGFRLDIFAPNPKNVSMTAALETYLKESNKK